MEDNYVSNAYRLYLENVYRQHFHQQERQQNYSVVFNSTGENSATATSTWASHLTETAAWYLSRKVRFECPRWECKLDNNGKLVSKLEE